MVPAHQPPSPQRPPASFLEEILLGSAAVTPPQTGVLGVFTPGPGTEVWKPCCGSAGVQTAVPDFPHPPQAGWLSLPGGAPLGEVTLVNEVL